MFVAFLRSPVYDFIVKCTQYERTTKEKVNDEENQTNWCIDYESDDNYYLTSVKNCINYTITVFLVLIMFITTYILYFIYFEDMG
jgi:hypothetical protein